MSAFSTCFNIHHHQPWNKNAHNRHSFARHFGPKDMDFFWSNVMRRERVLHHLLKMNVCAHFIVFYTNRFFGEHIKPANGARSVTNIQIHKVPPGLWANCGSSRQRLCNVCARRKNEATTQQPARWHQWRCSWKSETPVLLPLLAPLQC